MSRLHIYQFEILCHSGEARMVILSTGKDFIEGNQRYILRPLCRHPTWVKSEQAAFVQLCQGYQRVPAFKSV